MNYPRSPYTPLGKMPPNLPNGPITIRIPRVSQDFSIENQKLDISVANILWENGVPLSTLPKPPNTRAGVSLSFGELDRMEDMNTGEDVWRFDPQWPELEEVA